MSHQYFLQKMLSLDTFPLASDFLKWMRQYRHPLKFMRPMYTGFSIFWIC